MDKQGNVDPVPGFARLLAQFPWPDRPAFPDAPKVGRPIRGFDLIEQAVTGLNKRNPVIMEIGAEFGTSTLRSLAVPGAHVVSVDPWPDEYGYPSFPELAEHKGRPGDMYDLFRSYTFDFRDRLVAVRAYSPAGPKLVYDAGVRPDLVYIDGNHHYDAVTQDIVIASTLFPDAVIAGDDWKYNLALRRLEGVPFPVQLAVKRWAAARDVHIVTRDNQWLLDPTRPFNFEQTTPAFGLPEVAKRLYDIERQQRELALGQKRIASSLRQLPSRRVLRGVRAAVRRRRLSNS